MNPDTMQPALKEAQEAMEARRGYTSPGVVERDHLRVAPLEVNFKEYLKKDEKVYGKAKRCEISWKLSYDRVS